MGGTITTAFDPTVAHEQTRAALRAAIPRVVRLLSEAPDLDAPSGVPTWTVGDAASHLAAVYLGFCSATDADEALDWGSILPPDEGSFVERIAAVNARSIALFGAEERSGLGDFLTERGEKFLRTTEGLAPDAPVEVPWYGRELELSTVTGLMLSETLVHGLDIARGAGRPWPIDPDDARLVLGQSLPTMMRLAANPERLRDADLAFDLAVKGGPRLAVVVEDGTLTVTHDAPPRTYDCRITAAPTEFLLIAFARTPLWKPIARGRLRAGGRRPWLATRLSRLVATP